MMFIPKNLPERILSSCAPVLFLLPVIFLGVFLSAQNALAATCKGGKVGTCTSLSNCPPERNIGLCDDLSTCCAPETPPPPSNPTCVGGKQGICKLKSESCVSPDVEIGACTNLNYKCCGVPAPPPPPATCTGSGGKCVKSGDPCPDKWEPKGACLPSEGGGTCCKQPPTVPPGGGGGGPIEFKNPLAYDTVEQLLDSILDTLRSIIVTLALVFLVVGAVMYIVSSGNEGMMKMAKGAILCAMIGLALGLAAPSFLREISDILGWTSVNNTKVSGARTLSEIALSVLNFLLSVVGILSIIMLVIGGITLMTGATTGDEKNKVVTGKKIIKYAIVGIFVALASLVLVSQIAEFFM